jgi:hypothetical protein
MNKSSHGLDETTGVNWNFTLASFLRIRSCSVGPGGLVFRQRGAELIGVDQEVLPSMPFDGKCLMHRTNDHTAADTIMR